MSLKRAVLFLPLCLASLSFSQSWPQTRAERTNYNETSHYLDVIDFLRDLQRAGAPVTVQAIGKSTEGRDIPLAIASIPPVTSPAEARRLGKPIVFLQGNIHAGEVEGKEAALAVLRRLSQEGGKGLLGKLVVLVVPIYNIDGNEKWGPVERNRPEQDGPAIVGVRANGQGLDLNRDCIKAESPEMQAVLRHVYNAWDPDVMMDLHTTDGTRHGWELTYSPPLNPNTEPGIMRLTRDIMIPAVRKVVEREDKLPLFDYGNAEKRGDTTAWYTFGQEGRYVTNYGGLRNRIAILSEATTYIPFKDRVVATDKFVTRVLEYTARNAKAVVDATRKADATVVAWGLDPSKAPQLGVRFDFASRGMDTVLLEKKIEPRPTKRPTQIERVKMETYDRFKPVKFARLPYAYILPSEEKRTADLLQSHGIAVEMLDRVWAGVVDTFKISSFKQAERPFQNHKLIQLDGAFAPANAEIETGSYVVRTAQPLGILAFHILEPESLDGAAAWGFMGETFKVDSIFPVVKIMDPVALVTSKL